MGIPKSGILLIISIILIGIFILYAYSDSSPKKGTPINDPVTGDEIGTFTQKIIYQYQDGSSSEQTFWLYHGDKILESMTYQLYAVSETSINLSISSYSLQLKIINSQGNTLRTKQISFDDYPKATISSSTLIYEQVFDPFSFVNYTYPDGVYTLQLTPTGTITVDQTTVTLDPMSFEITVKDERTVNIDFN